MQRFKNILLVTQVPDIKGPAFQRAVSLAAANNARLTIADVLTLPGKEHPEGNILFDSLIEERKLLIEGLLKDLPGELEISVKILTGKPFYEIIQAVLRECYDLVIKSPDPEKSIKTSLFGSTDMHLLRKCPCPVWIVKVEEARPVNRILAAVDLESYGDDEDLSALNRQILEMSASLADCDSCELHVVHAWVTMGEKLLHFPWSNFLKDDVEEWMRSQREDMQVSKDEFDSMLLDILKSKNIDNLTPQIHMVEGDAEDVVPDMVEENEIDLLVMGTLSRTDLAGFFIGSTAETILSSVNTSVLAVKPAGFVSPVTLE